MKWFRRKELREQVESPISGISRVARPLAGEDAYAALTLSAAQSCIALIARCFASAEIDGTELLPPRTIEMMARQMLVEGSSVALIQPSGLRVAGSHSVTGKSLDPQSWNYDLTIAAPSDSMRMQVMGSDVVHWMATASVHAPHVGLAPLHLAGDTFALAGTVDRALREESRSIVGNLLSFRQPSGVSGGSEPIAEFQAAMAGLRGEHLLIDQERERGTSTAGFFSVLKLRPEPASTSLDLRDKLIRDVCGVYGCPPELFMQAAGPSRREAFRHLILSTVMPLGDLLASELTEKLETPVMLHFDKLRFSDLQALGRGASALASAGFSVDDVAKLAGLERDRND